MGRGDDLHSAFRSLPFDQIDQEMKPHRVDTVVDFLEEMETSWILAEQRGQQGKKPQGAVRCAVGGYISSGFFLQPEMDPAGRVFGKLERGMPRHDI